MCGRYADFIETQDVLDTFAVAEAADDSRLLPPSWNVAPTQRARIIVPVAGGSVRRLVTARWGLVPPWASDAKAGFATFNARSETVAEKPMFRSAFAKRRCVVPANGYFEWTVTAEGKRPVYVTTSDERPMAFAGLWESRKGEATEVDSVSLTFTIITTPAQGALADIHDRQPVMLTADAIDPWLHQETDHVELAAIMAADAPPWTRWAVSAAVGNVRNNGPELVEPP